MVAITILGSGSTNLLTGRNAASVLIERDGGAVVYDFGRGTALRLVELGFKQDDIQTIVLSHYHPDHVSDLIPFLHAASWSQIDKRTKPLTIYGPVGLEDFISKFFEPFGSEELSRGFAIVLKSVSEHIPTLIEGSAYEFVDLDHSFGMRFAEGGKKYAILSDSSLHGRLIDALHGIELGIFDSGHITDEEIVELAVRSQAKTLVGSHQYRNLDEPALNEAARSRGYKGRIVAAEDQMRFQL